MLEKLLWDCFEGPNKCEADGLSASLHEVPKDSVTLAFRLDGNAFREASGLGDGKCCDRLLLVAQRPPSREPRLTLFLLEMKGSKYQDAIEQLETTLSVLQAHLRGCLSTASYGRTRFVAVLVSDRVLSLGPRTGDEKRFRQKHRATLHTLTAMRARAGREPTSVDLSALLRPVAD